MKKTFIITLFSLAVIACGNPEEKSIDALVEDGSLRELQQKKSELSQRQNELTQELDRLNAAIGQLDPSRNRALVQIERVQDTVFKHFSEVQGDVTTDENIIIFSETSGILTDVRVTEGQQVQKGQVLAVVDDGGLASELARLETQAELAQTTFERQERLWEQNIGSEMQYLQARSNYEAAQRSVEQVRTRLNKSTIRAPFSGTIDEVITEQGEVVSPGVNQLFRLINLENMYVEADIPENYLGAVKEGTEVRVRIGSIGLEFSGNVRRVGNTINPSNRTFKIEVSIPNENGLVKPNQIATVSFNDYTNENAIIVPERIVQQNAQGQSLIYVWNAQTETTGTAERRIVETGRVYDSQVEITSGIEPGQTIITEGSRNLRDGQEVEIEANNSNE